jgi:hypothetical protein
MLCLLVIADFNDWTSQFAKRSVLYLFRMILNVREHGQVPLESTHVIPTERSSQGEAELAGSWYLLKSDAISGRFLLNTAVKLRYERSVLHFLGFRTSTVS